MPASVLTSVGVNTFIWCIVIASRESSLAVPSNTHGTELHFDPGLDLRPLRMLLEVELPDQLLLVSMSKSIYTPVRLISISFGGGLRVFSFLSCCLLKSGWPDASV